MRSTRTFGKRKRLATDKCLTVWLEGRAYGRLNRYAVKTSQTKAAVINHLIKKGITS